MQAIPMKYLHPTVEAAPEFASLPYDVFDRAEAKAYVEAHPNSFLAIDRPETQFPDDQDMYAPEVYQRAREMLNAAEENGTLVADEVPCYYLYRQTRGEHIQTGIVAGCSIDDYADGTIKKHENTRAEKLGDRITHIATTGAHTGPIFWPSATTTVLLASWPRQHLPSRSTTLLVEMMSATPSGALPMPQRLPSSRLLSMPFRAPILPMATTAVQALRKLASICVPRRARASRATTSSRYSSLQASFSACPTTAL